jgi:hypothetical protein
MSDTIVAIALLLSMMLSVVMLFNMRREASPNGGR